jgi:hypothetical protein
MIRDADIDGDGQVQFLLMTVSNYTVNVAA